MQFIAARKLQPHCFYRVDRCDFNLDPCRHVAPEAFEQAALQNVFYVNRRQGPAIYDVEPEAPLDPFQPVAEEFLRRGSFARVEERLDRHAHMAFSEDATALRLKLQALMQEPEIKEMCADREYYLRFGLHTNASGDFFLTSRKAFSDIAGMIETHTFYTHIDSYAVVQLFAAGYTQALFLPPHSIYHADHSRADRLDFKEPLPYSHHEEEFSRMLRGERSFRFNGANWGMADFNLPVWESP